MGGEPLCDRGKPKYYIQNPALDRLPQMVHTRRCADGNRGERGNYVGLGYFPYSAKSGGYRCLEWALIRRRPDNYNSKVEGNSKDGEGDENAGHGGVDGRHVFAQSTGEEEEGDLEHKRETLDEEVEGPFLQSVALALTVSATLDHRPTGMSQVPVEPLFAQHRDERGKQRDQEARVHQSSDSDDLAGGTFLNRWNSGSCVRDNGLIEGEEECAEESCGLLVRVGL